MLTALGHIVPFAFAAGINVYATVAVLGLCSHYGLVGLPDEFRAFNHPAVITVAIVLYVVEFVADKIPWVDTLWDAVHTVVRPVGGAIVAVAAMGEATPAMNTLAALLGGSVAMTTHLTKAGTRAAANTSPEPFSNWLLSLSEDVLVVGLVYGAIRHPAIALTVAVVLLVAIIAFTSVLIRFVRQRFASVAEDYTVPPASSA